MAPRTLAFMSVCLLALSTLAAAEVGSPGQPPPNACALAGLLGTCNGCVCCCGPEPGKAPVLVPDGCACTRELDSIDAAARTTALAAAGGCVVAVTLLALAWFGRCCCSTPYEEDA